MSYALVVVSKEVKGQGGHVMTEAGELFLVTKECEGWVLATTVHYDEGMEIPTDTTLFETKEEVKAFLKKWKGHPWWCRPSKEYYLLTVVPKYKQVLNGYSLVGEKERCK